MDAFSELAEIVCKVIETADRVCIFQLIFIRKEVDGCTASLLL